ncbi:hypothetical protein [Streptomyces sp. SA3_actF]|uniref:hypothetical protein n=1 Tax=Streptomyces sp. SA3_actF TaxID=682181 RepID=UPI001F38998D|nr:hypothetical protein [Streptomyces sp. SA3_actF]
MADPRERAELAEHGDVPLYGGAVKVEAGRGAVEVVEDQALDEVHPGGEVFGDAQGCGVRAGVEADGDEPAYGALPRAGLGVPGVGRGHLVEVKRDRGPCRFGAWRNGAAAGRA